MFVNRLRNMLHGYELFNLAHRGYGSDQELLTFKHWRDKRNLKLMFCENDVADNNSMFRYGKPKPRYQLVENKLMLVGVPVPKDESWTQSRKKTAADFWEKIAENLFRSHFLHDVYFRSAQFWARNNTQRIRKKPDVTLTSRILGEFKSEAERKGANFVVVFIPSKREIEKVADSLPYQIEMADLCQRLSIDYLDLALNFKKTWNRTYYRHGMHWNPLGHKVAAEALYDYITRNASL
jgi:SGNH hydrolase-like domain, acetyltransferase AlgX